jgi:putative CocE/NonD family hydrolase
MRRTRFLTCCAVASLLALADSRAQQEPGSHPHRSADVAIPMRDGVTLRADILLPNAVEGDSTQRARVSRVPATLGASEGKFPALIYRTPYGKHFALKEYTTFEKAVARGYAVVVQDVRGRYASDGEFVAYQNEGRDGFDTIEWVAKQQWCDGNVGTFGLSYPGAVQWLAAVENPPHLKAMAPAMTFSTPRNFFYSGGVFDGSWLEWIWMNIAPDIRRRNNLAGPRSYEEAAESWKREHEGMQSFLPLSELPDLKEVSPFYYEWLGHPPADEWWDWAELRNKYGKVHAAVLNLSGWYDEAYGPDGATTNFNGLLKERGEKDARTRTIIGAWTHGGQEKTKAGEREFGASAAIDYDELILRWMDHYVRGMQNGVEREKPVRIFVMGKNEWRDEDAWPLARAETRTYYLRSESNSARYARLNQTPPNRDGAYNEIFSDPAHPVTDRYSAYGAHNYRALAGGKDVLVYDSDPLLADTEVTGPIHAEIFISADVPDVDLWVRLLDVAPDGTALNLMSPGLDVLRASYRDEKKEPELLKAGEVYRLNLDRMLTSNVFRAGHQIRVQISGAFFPHFSRNLQSGEPEATSARMCPGHIRIHHDPDHRSRIELPVVAR